MRPEFPNNQVEELTLPPYVRGQIDERARWISWGTLAVVFWPALQAIEWLFQQSLIFEALLTFPLIFWFIGFSWCQDRVHDWLLARATRFRRERGYWLALGPTSRD